MGASNGKMVASSPSPPPFALKRRCSSGAAQAELVKRGCCFHGLVGHGRSSTLRVKPAGASKQNDIGGVFDPSRSHPTVAHLISDLKGEVHSPNVSSRALVRVSTDENINTAVRLCPSKRILYRTLSDHTLSALAVRGRRSRRSQQGSRRDGGVRDDGLNGAAT